MPRRPTAMPVTFGVGDNVGRPIFAAGCQLLIGFADGPVARATFSFK